jgi:hypothetical protein
VKRRLSRRMDTTGSSSETSIRTGTERGRRMRTAEGDCKTKKSSAMTLAVMWEGAEGTQDDPSLPSIRGKRFARTITSEMAQIHAATQWMRVRRSGRGVMTNGIGTPPSENSLPFHSTPVGLNASRGRTSEFSLGDPARVPILLCQLRFCLYCLP